MCYCEVYLQKVPKFELAELCAMEYGDTRLVREVIDSCSEEPLLRVFGTFTYELFDHYATVCDWLVFGSISLMMNSMNNLSAFLEDFNESTSNVFAVPIAMLTALFKVVTTLISIVSFPMRVLQAVGRNYPIFTLIVLSFFVMCYFSIRRITRQSAVNYFLYTFIPYCVSIVYTIFGFIFPQVHTISRLMQIILHPIRWILGIAEQVDRRAGPIREVVEVFSSPGERRRGGASLRRRSSTSSTVSAEKANNERIQCCICIYREKKILLRPCNHICLCETCFQAVMNESPPKCPICRAEIESHMNVFL